MHIYEYMRDRASLLLTICAIVCLIVVMLYLLSISWLLIDVLLIGIILCVLIGTTIDYIFYLRSLRAFNILASIPSTHVLLDESNMRSVMRPLAPELQDAVDHLMQLAHEEVREMEAELSAQKQYTELWVHEIKTPLAAVRLLLRNQNSGFIEDTVFEIDKINHLVDQALYYARSSSVSNDFFIKELCLKDVVSRAIQSYTKILISAHIVPKLHNLDLVVEADAKWLQFIIEQLCSNAAKYRKPNSETAELSFSATQIKGENGVWDSCLTIKDEGIGIPASDIDRVFDRAFTGENGRRSAVSTGMGLYLVRELAKKMNILVSIDSVEGEGTQVHLYFSSSLHDVL